MGELKEVKPKPNKRVIEILEENLKLAKTGELQGIAITTAYNDASTGTQFHLGGYVIAMLGEIRILERDIIDCLVDTRRKPVWEDE